MPAVEHLLVRCIEHLEGRHDLPGGHRVDLHAALRELVQALGEGLEMLLQRVARRPARLHLEDLRRLPGGAEGKSGDGKGRSDRYGWRMLHLGLPGWLRSKLNPRRPQVNEARR